MLQITVLCRKLTILFYLFIVSINPLIVAVMGFHDVLVYRVTDVFCEHNGMFVDGLR